MIVKTLSDHLLKAHHMQGTGLSEWNPDPGKFYSLGPRAYWFNEQASDSEDKNQYWNNRI